MQESGTSVPGLVNTTTERKHHDVRQATISLDWMNGVRDSRQAHTGA